MKRRRSLGGWCGLGLAVAALAGGAYAGKGYAEQHMLAAVLGSGVRAESVQWHWRQSAGCAERVEIPLNNIRDAQDQALQLYAPKLWFVYDQAAMLRKRLVLPRIVMEDVIIATSADRLMAEQIVDIRSDTGIELENLVELPSDGIAPGDAAEPNVTDVNLADPSALPSVAGRPSAFVCQPTGLALPWLDQLQALCETVQSERALAGRQVSVDADMLNERIQAHFEDSRQHAQRLIAEARDLQQQLVNMDNVLRQRELTEITGRLENIKRQLINLKVEVGNSGKLLDDEQSRLRAALRVEKMQLLQQADNYKAPSGRDVADVILAHLVGEQLAQPSRAIVLMSDLMRKPFDMRGLSRGQQLRYLDHEPEFAARSARISGKLDMDGKLWPFMAEGKFEVLSGTPAAESEVRRIAGSSQWHMSIDAQSASWKLEGDCPAADGPCVVTLTSAESDGLRVRCQVDAAQISGSGRLGLRRALALAQTRQSLIDGFAGNYRAQQLLKRLIVDAVVVDDQTPEEVEFELAALNQSAGCHLDDASVAWLAMRLQTVATACAGEVYRQAAEQLDGLIAGKLTDQKGMMATLRRDAEQYVEAQQEELRRIQATANSLIEQRQTNYYFARQPGELPR